jgi:hypothetical protein
LAILSVRRRLTAGCVRFSTFRNVFRAYIVN